MGVVKIAMLVFGEHDERIGSLDFLGAMFLDRNMLDCMCPNYIYI